MISKRNREYMRALEAAPLAIQELAQKNYELWKSNPGHPSLDFKRVGRTLPVYSVRIGAHWRVLGVRDEDVMVWFWIGSHAEYDRLLTGL